MRKARGRGRRRSNKCERKREVVQGFTVLDNEETIVGMVLKIYI